jgi:hypothetical protein
MVRGAADSSVFKHADTLFAMFTYPCVTKWTPSFAVTFLSSANLFAVLAVLVQVVVQQVSRLT